MGRFEGPSIEVSGAGRNLWVCMMTLKLEERTQAMVATVHAILNLIL
jgi:hypothetical protein